MPDIERLPIYFVITEQVHIYPWSTRYGLKFIKQVIQCDIADLDDIYARIVNPMYNEGQRIQCEMYLREPPSPFRNWKEIELAQLKESQERDRRDRIAYLERYGKTEADARELDELQQFLHGPTIHPAEDDKPGALPGD